MKNSIFILDDPLLIDFKLRLEGCITKDEWDAVVYELIFKLMAVLVATSNPNYEEQERLAQFMRLLQSGPAPRKVGRPSNDREAEEDGKLFQLMKPQTPADGARLLMHPLPDNVAQFSRIAARNAESMTLLLQIWREDATDAQSQTVAYSAALKRAERARYAFPSKGVPFRKLRKKPT